MRREFIEGSDGKLAILRWDQAGPSAPLLHFAHATGLNAETYWELLEPLSRNYRIVASDSRGHGRTTLPADPERLHGWELFETDLEYLIESIGHPTLLIGHSLGATTSLMLAARRPELVHGVIMVEPAIIPYAFCRQIDIDRRAGKHPDFAMAQAAGKRRPTWPSRDAIRDAYRGRGMFASWPETWLDHYLDGGLQGLADGAVTLACAPAWERATFRTVATNFWQRLPRYTGYLALMRGTGPATVSDDDAAKIIALAPQTVDSVFDRKSHFLPMEAPEDLEIAVTAAAKRALAQRDAPTAGLLARSNERR
jgi:pimeloyl-ACP methyl ester carboxylesterase